MFSEINRSMIEMDDFETLFPFVRTPGSPYSTEGLDIMDYGFAISCNIRDFCGLVLVFRSSHLKSCRQSLQNLDPSPHGPSSC